MKVFTYIVFAIFGLFIYFLGIYFISGDFSLMPFTEFLEDFKVYQNDFFMTCITLLLFLVFSKIVLALFSRLWLRAMWLGIVVLTTGMFTGILLLLEYITFLDSRLLKITSVFLATSIIGISFLSLVAAFTLYQYRKQRGEEELLYKISVRNPKSLMFVATIRNSEVLLAPVILLCYLVLIHFDSLYSDEAAIYTLNVLSYTVAVIFSLFFFAYASIRRGRRLLR